MEPADGRSFKGRLRAPGDKSISHRALLIAARAEGRSLVRGLSNGEDVRHTLEAVVALGRPGRAGRRELYVDGGVGRLREPEHLIDVGNSGTGIRLLTGFVSAIDGLTVLQGDSSIAKRPMDRVAVPLRLMGAQVDGRQGGRFPPLAVRGGRLEGIEYTLPVASAQVKSAVLFAGLGAEGATTVHEPVATRAHTEEMLAAAGANIEVRPHEEPGSDRRPAPRPAPRHHDRRPRRPLSGCLLGRRCVHNARAATSCWRTCTSAGAEPVSSTSCVRMGARLELVDEDPLRHTADIHVQAGPLVATDVGGPEVASLIDEVPFWRWRLPLPRGRPRFSDAAELRVKETDRVATTVELLTALGARAEPASDGLVVSRQRGCAPSRLAPSTRTGTTASPWPARWPRWGPAAR